MIGTVVLLQVQLRKNWQRWVGRPVLFRLDKPMTETKEAILEIKELQVKGNADIHQLNNLSLTVKAGEIYGIAGVD